MDEQITVSPSVNIFENQAYSRQKYYDEVFNGGGVEPKISSACRQRSVI
ncbi:MAG: hypothetical protein LBM09_02660 [Candidatus Nomurabacteria bacterium]|nr:hypothetical protein [Candidatus Nomurabacteria bacterium]